MYAPRILVRSTLVSRPLQNLPRAAPAIRRRFISRTRPRFSHDDPQQHLRNARPLVPDQIANRFTRAGSGRNSRVLVVATVVAAVAFYFYNSQTVPVTGRRRFNFLSDTMVARAHSKAAEGIIQQVKAQGGHFLSDWDPRTILVKRVMKRLIPVSGMTDLNWEIFVIADNRTCLSLRSGGYEADIWTSRNRERLCSPRRQGLCTQRNPQRVP